MATYRGATLSIRGVKETIRNFEKLNGGAFDGPKLYAVLGKAVQPIATQARANFSQFSDKVANSIYVADKQPTSRPKKKTALVVLHKADTMREWAAGPGNTSPRAKVGIGRKVAESLATMWELGTTRRWKTGAGMESHFAFRSAHTQRKGEVKDLLISGVKQLVEETVLAMNVKKPT